MGVEGEEWSNLWWVYWYTPPFGGCRYMTRRDLCALVGICWAVPPLWDMVLCTMNPGLPRPLRAGKMLKGPWSTLLTWSSLFVGQGMVISPTKLGQYLFHPRFNQPNRDIRIHPLIINPINAASPWTKSHKPSKNIRKIGLFVRGFTMSLEGNLQ